MADIPTARRSDTDIAYVLYAMHAIAPFTMWTLAVIAVFFGAVTRDRVRGTFLDSHFGWLQRTFWFGLAWLVVVTIVFTVTIIGFFLLFIPWFILTVWYLYRVFRGWLLLRDGLPAPE
jgi:uncharacterized membrane protein